MSGWEEFAHALGGAPAADPCVPVTCEETIERSAGVFGLSLDDLRRHDRRGRVVHARKIAMAEARVAGFTYAAIGDALRRDHTTVLAGVRSLAR